MTDMVIVAYRPKPGCEAALADLVTDHVPFLRRLGLATDRPASIMRAADGTIVEVFEWRAGAVETAHTLPEIHQLWARYDELCTYLPLRELPEAAAMFATFKPV